MRPKLTQYLIDKGYATEDQCSEALQRQVIFGGRIGTNLQELLYITEDQLLDALSHCLHIPIADPEQLQKIDPSLIEQIPEDLARKYKVAPFESSKGRIHLAMTDPTNMEALDEISFITGKVIKPFITTELKMSFLLGKYYNISQERRFISIPEEERKRREEWKKRKEAAETSAQSRQTKTESATTLEESSAALKAPDTTTFEGASQALAMAGNRDEIAEILLTFANFRLERTGLFIMKGGNVQGWKVGGVWKYPEHVAKIRFPYKEQTLFHDVAESNQPYKGTLLQIETHKKIIGTLGVPYPKEVVAFPMTIRKRVFSVLYGDNAISRDPFRDLEAIRKIALKASLSFEVLILKAKILFQN